MTLHPDFPVVEGRYRITPEWSVVLPGRFNRRFEDGSLVLWRPGLTVWTIVWGNDRNESNEQRHAKLLQRRAPGAFAEKTVARNGILFHMYRLAEPSDDERVAALYGYAFGADGHVQMSLYFDAEKDVAVAESICLSVRNEEAET